MSALTIVHVAQALAHTGLPAQDDEPLAGIDRVHLEAAGVLERLPVWLHQCRAAQAETAS